MHLVIEQKELKLFFSENAYKINKMVSKQSECKANLKIYDSNLKGSMKRLHPSKKIY